MDALKVSLKNVGAAVVGRFGPQFQLTYRLSPGPQMGDIDVYPRRYAVQLAVAYIPEEDDWILNW